MTTSAQYAASAAPRSFLDTLSAVWDALVYSLAMAREMSDTGHVTARQMSKVRKMAARF
ncbi:MAG: hypothetical protein ACO1N5_10660 [Noviherbaspirillum sp.]